MRLIDADALIGALHHYAFLEGDDRSNKSICYNIIRRQPTIEPEPQWIPCSERLPEATGFYICTVNRELFDVRRMKFELLDEDGYRWLLENGLEVFPSFVLAWMPQPKPWKGADDET